ncbi:mCG1041723 [Mus musculus]|nr:mCG1041723 [Mus musculus]
MLYFFLSLGKEKLLLNEVSSGSYRGYGRREETALHLGTKLFRISIYQQARDLCKQRPAHTS